MVEKHYRIKSIDETIRLKDVVGFESAHPNYIITVMMGGGPRSLNVKREEFAEILNLLKSPTATGIFSSND